MDSISQFISTLLASRNQAHVFHWQVEGPGSYSAHKALNKYYDEILEATDELVESYQGRYGIIKGYTSPATFKEDSQFITYFEALSKYIETARRTLVPEDTYIQNQIDEIVKLIETTKYKLKYLH